MNMNEYQNYHENIFHTSAEFPYNTYLCSIPLDFTQVPLHWHEEMELIVIKRGTGTVSVNLTESSVSAGDIVLVLPGQLHAIRQKSHCTMEYENILLDPSMLICGGQDLCAAQYIHPLVCGNLPVETVFTPALSYYTDIASCIENIDRLCDLRPDGYQLAVKGWLFQFFYYLVQNQKNNGSVSRPDTKSLEKIKTILRYVEEHYSEPISIDDMAKITHYSKSHFMKFFRQHMGTSFIEYLNSYRLTIAARLLTTTDSSILEVAAQSGFENLSYFNRLFRRKFQQTPGEFRTGSRLIPHSGIV